MNIFPWQDEYSIQVDSIDKQHMHLVSLLNELASEMAKGKGKIVLDKILNGIIEYTIYHFEEEEKYFSQIDYPNAENHKAEHKELIGQVSKFKEDYDNGKIGLTVEIMKFLKEWVINHINNTDKDLGYLLGEKGIK